jgi:hypothetical protein
MPEVAEEEDKNEYNNESQETPFVIVIHGAFVADTTMNCRCKSNSATPANLEDVRNQQRWDAISLQACARAEF